MAEDSHDGPPPDGTDEEVAAAVAEDTDAFLAVVPHFYRGVVSEANNAQNRIDRTTNWAITVLAALLSVVFSNPDMPAYLLLIGVLVLSIFLSYEVRRYRYYDLYRSRVRFLEQNVFANAMRPSGVEHERWREELSDDLRRPKFKVSWREALSRRTRRIYGLLFAILGVAWAAKVTLFTPQARWDEAASLPGVPGPVVAVALAAFYVGLVLLAQWPSEREAKGEIHGEEPGEWKNE